MDPAITPETPQPVTHTEWESVLATLRRRHPGASDGILFCVYKLQQNPSATLRDFRDEARLHGLSVAGRSLHSARQLLGLAGETTPRNGPQSMGRGRTRRAVPDDDDDPSLEDRVIDAVRRIQESATSQSRKLREAMQEAIRILQRALDDR